VLTHAGRNSNRNKGTGHIDTTNTSGCQSICECSNAHKSQKGDRCVKRGTDHPVVGHPDHWGDKNCQPNDQNLGSNRITATAEKPQSNFHKKHEKDESIDNPIRI
jgi:hypothetical protein